MTPEDWPSVHRIYLEGIATQEATFETTVAQDWQSWDESHLHHSRMVAVRDGTVVGWAALSPVSRRTVYRGVAEVSVYVAVNARHQGIGTRLLAELITASEEAGIWTLQAAVFPENRATVRLQRAAGFREVGRRERIGKHHGRWRDTILLERRSDTVGLT
jgi:phosphinothricin acetyltransferase